MTTYDDRPCFIYAITHTKSGRRYVGSCLNASRRWLEHRSQLRNGRHHCDHLQHAWDKYGSDAFVFSILEHLTTNESVGRAKAELRAIAQSECYNSRIANLGLTNFINSPATRAKINAGIAKRISEDDEHRLWLHLRGTQLAEQAKTPERRAMQSLLSKERWTDPHHRQHISKKLASHWKRDGIREKHSVRVKLHRSTPEARRKNSATTKLLWTDPDGNLRNRKQTRWSDPEERKIQSGKMREIWAKRRADKAKRLRDALDEF